MSTDSPPDGNETGTNERADAVLAIPDLLFEVDDALRVLSFRPARPDSLATPPADFIGRPILDVLPLSCRDAVGAAFHAAARDGFAVGAPYKMETSEGDRWGEASIARMDLPVATEVRFVVLARDITARVRATEATVAESEARFVAAFHGNRAALCIRRRRDDVLLEVNPAFEGLFGRTRDELVGRTADCLGLYSDFEHGVELVRSREGDRGFPRHKSTFRHPDGRLRHIVAEISDIHVGGEDCSLAHVVDETAHRESESLGRRAQEALATSERRLAEAHRLAGLGAWERNLVTEEGWWSEEQYRLWGVPDDTTITHALFLSMVHVDDLDRVKRHVERLLREGRWSVEFRIVRPDGAVRHVHSVATLFRDAEGKPLRLAGTNLDITARTRADEALRASEERYRRVVEGAVDGIYNVAADGTLLAVNQAYARMLGYDAAADLIGHNHNEFCEDPGARNRIRGTDAATITGGELVWHTRAGRRIIVELSERVVRDSLGNVIGYDGIARNVTAQRQRDAALRVLSTDITRLSGVALFDELASRLAAIVGTDSAFVCKLMPGAAPRVRTVSLVDEGVLRPTEEFSLQGTPCEVVCGGATLVIVEGVEKRFPTDARLSAMGAEGYAAIPLRNGENQIVGVVGVLSRRPLADEEHLVSILRMFAVRAGAELERLRTESLFLAVFESAPDALLIANASGRIVQANDVAQTTLGYTRDELLQMKVEDLIPVPLRPSHPPLRTEFLERGRSRKMGSGRSLVRALRKDGMELPVEISLSPLLTDGEPLVVAAIRDVTEQQRGAEQRLRLEEQLRHRHRLEALGTLAGGIAHDLNNILTPIVGNVELARRHVRPGSLLGRCVDEIAMASDRATKLVAQILTFGRKQQPHHRTPTQVRSVLDEVTTLVRNSLPPGVELSGSILSDPTVLVDPTQLHQVLMNLATNAVQAIRGERGRVTIELDEVPFDHCSSAAPALVPGQYARVRITDNGTGMDTTTRERIFDPFFTTKAGGKGTGLGLAVVDGIVSTLRGAITVESTIEVGTTFTVYLPAAPREASEPPPTPTFFQRAEGRVLVVDDDASVLLATCTLLGSIGYTVTSFSSAPRALEAVRLNPMAFDVVVTDRNMPDMDGVEFAREVAKARPDMPVVLVSGNCIYTEEELIGAKIRHFIAKPFSRHDIATLLARAMAKPPPS